MTMANTSKDEAEEQQRDTSSSPLPSYGMSNYVDITNQETLRRMLDGISQGNLNVQNMRRESGASADVVVLRGDQNGSHSFPNENGSRSSSGSSSQGENQNDVASIFNSGNQFIKMEGDTLKEEALENSYVLDFLGNLGNTECIQTANLNTIDSQQIQQPVAMVSEDDQLFGEGVAMEVTVVESQLENFLEPKIKFTEVAKYSRFRYESERTKTQRATKGRTADQADDYKSLGTVKIEGYAGKAQLVIFCVDAQDRIHPYSLHGDSCENGIYQQVMDLKGDISIKLNKVSFTTPKSKQYQNIFKKRRDDLKDFHIDVHSMKNTDMDKSDKNTVYLHAEVLLGDAATRKHTVSDAIHNKKEGNEFKIYTIEPASAPATGFQPGNPNKNRVLIVVTDGTAFPKHVGVKIRSKTGRPWEVMVPKKDITCIKKAVVEFIPPPFWNTNTDTNEEMEVCLVDEDTKDESNSVQFLYYSVQDLDGVNERKRKKPRLDGSAEASCPRRPSGASATVLGSLDPKWKQKFERELQATETSINLPRYSEMYDNQRPAEAGNGKIYSLKDSLKDNTQNDDLVPRGARGRSVQLKEETGQGRSCMVPGASQSPVRRSDLPELKQSQMTVNLPKQSANWSQGLQSPNLPARPPTTAVVTSASGSAANNKVACNSLEPTVAYPPRLASISEGTQQNDLQMQQEQLPQPQQTEPDNRQLAWQQQQILQEQQAGQIQAQQSDFQGYQAQSAPQQTQSLGGQQLLLQGQLGQLQIQSSDFQLHLAQSATLQPQNQVEPVQQHQQILQQQTHQLQQPQQQQQQQQSTNLPDNQMQQEQPNSSLMEKRLKHELLSKLLEEQARQLNPDFKLPPNQMFLLLGNNLTIADKSLIDCAFSLPAAHPLSSTLEQSMTAQSQHSSNQLQGQVQGMTGNCEQSGTASGILQQQIGQPYGGQVQAAQVQPPPLVQQQSYSHLQNSTTLVAGAGSQLQNPLALPAQQYPGSSQPLQRGTSLGMQPNYSMGQGGVMQQRSVQPGQSIFPRNNLPFSSANLDDDDVEIDSEGPKRKQPIQLYGKSSKKANNGSDRNVIDLTIENNETVNGKSDLNDDDLETDYSGPDSANKYACKVVLKRMDTSNKTLKLTGVYMYETVRKESVNDIEMELVAEDSGVFSMEEKT